MSNYYVEDLNSTNGTYVNGQKLEPHKPKEINVGDQITVADIDFIVAVSYTHLDVYKRQK